MNKGTLRRKVNANGKVRWYLDLRDGTPWIKCPTVTTDDEATAEQWRASYVAAMIRLGAAGPKTAGPETVSKWFDRWLLAREAKGLASTKSDRGRFRKWVEPSIGAKLIAEVTKRDLEAIVERLDRAVQESAARIQRGQPGPTFRGKTATNAWGLVTKMFHDACGSKVLALRVREDNPARDVEGPDKGVEREGPYLYPAEYQRLIACERVPVRWRRLITLATFLYIRRGELEALDWTSVNLEQGYVHIHQADGANGIKSTKTGHNRKVPIEATLVPLLEMMKEEAGGEGSVITSMPPDEELAKRLRRYLEWAGVTRAELFARDATRRPIVWHDLRHTGASWRCIRGDSTKKIQRAGGWRTASMLDRYCNEAETFESLATFGEVFPPLPLALFRHFTDDVTGAVTAAVTVGASDALTSQDQRGFGGVPKGIRTIAETPKNKALREDAVPSSGPVAPSHARLAPDPVPDLVAVLTATLRDARSTGNERLIMLALEELREARLAAAGNVVTIDSAKRRRGY